MFPVKRYILSLSAMTLLLCMTFFLLFSGLYDRQMRKCRDELLSARQKERQDAVEEYGYIIAFDHVDPQDYGRRIDYPYDTAAVLPPYSGQQTENVTVVRITHPYKVLSQVSLSGTDQDYPFPEAGTILEMNYHGTDYLVYTDYRYIRSGPAMSFFFESTEKYSILLDITGEKESFHNAVLPCIAAAGILLFANAFILYFALRPKKEKRQIQEDPAEETAVKPVIPSFDLSVLCRETVESLAEKGIPISGSAVPHAEVCCRREVINRLLTTLLCYAAGEITVTLAPETEGRYRLTVSDTEGFAENTESDCRVLLNETENVTLTREDGCTVSLFFRDPDKEPSGKEENHV